MKVIIAAWRIPDGSKVTKVTGKKVYIIRSTLELTIYGPEGKKILPFNAEQGNARLLTTEENPYDITLVDADQELAWAVPDMHLYFWLQEQLEEITR